MAFGSRSLTGIFAAAALFVAAGAFAIAAPKQETKPAKPAAPAAQRKEAPRNKDEPNIAAPHAILIAADNGGVLYERDPDKLIFPASLAKLMTAEYVFNEIKEGRLNLTDEYLVSENAWRKGGAPSHGSTMFASLNSRVPVDDLLRGLAVVSGNDACIVLAEGIAADLRGPAGQIFAVEESRPLARRKRGAGQGCHRKGEKARANRIHGGNFGARGGVVEEKACEGRRENPPPRTPRAQRTEKT